MARDYEVNRQFADSWSPALSKIITDNVGLIATVKPAGNAADRAACTDFVVSTSSGNTVAARVRRADVKFRDFTLRAKSGDQRTELEKIRDGYGDWFLYAWLGDHESVADWMLVDLNRMRASGILHQQRPVKMNDDGRTGFVVYTKLDLINADCLAKQMHDWRTSNRCGYGRHKFADAVTNGKKCARCSVCGALYGYYETNDSPSCLHLIRQTSSRHE